VISSGPAPWLFRRIGQTGARTDEAELRIEDTLIIGSEASVAVQPNVTLKLEMTRTTVVGSRLLTLERIHPLEVRTTQCALALQQSMLWWLRSTSAQGAGLWTWQGDRNAYAAQPLELGFLRWRGQPVADPARTPEAWSSPPADAGEIAPTMIELTAFPTAAPTLEELRRALAHWLEENRSALNSAAPRGAAVEDLVMDLARSE
jgi:hypothetical protein